jgi:AraC-like DNA-binding protein
VWRERLGERRERDARRIEKAAELLLGALPPTGHDQHLDVEQQRLELAVVHATRSGSTRSRTTSRAVDAIALRQFRRTATAHHISLRYLHKLFEGQPTTASGWIRQRRLERCRRDLLDPALGDRSVGAIAARWGLIDAAHFSRLFRAAYGLPPGEYRLAAMADTDEPGGHQR